MLMTAKHAWHSFARGSQPRQSAGTAGRRPGERDRVSQSPKSFVGRVLQRVCGFTQGALAAASFSAVLVLAAWTACAQPRVRSAPPSSWPGFKRGEVQSVRVAGHYAYLTLSHSGRTGGLSVVDVSDPTKPFPVGGCDTDGPGLGIDVADGYAYVAAHGAGLVVFDVRDPSRPKRVAGSNLGGFAWDVQVVGHYAYAAITDIGLVVFDVSQPTNLARVATYAMPGWVKKLQVVSNYVYMAFVSQLEIVRVTDATNLTHAGSYTAPDLNSLGDVQVAGDLAFLSSGSALQILNVSNRALPTLLGSIDLSSATAVKVADGYAYVTEGWGNLTVLDIQDPAQPAKIGVASVGEWAQDLDVQGAYAFVVASDSGLQVVDLNDPFVPARVGSYAASGSTSDVQVSGHYAFLADGAAGLEVIDVSNPAAPVWAGGYFTGNPITGLQLFSSYALISTWGGLLMLDVSDPPQPRLAGAFSGNEAIMGFQVVGPYAYVACDAAGLRIIDVSSPTNLVSVGQGLLPDYGFIISVRVDGDRAYVGIDRDVQVDQGVFDVSVPTNPVFLGTFTSNWVWDTAVVGQYLLVADSTPLLKVYDNSAPTNRVLAASFPTADLVYRMLVDGNYVYLYEGSAGVQVLDVSNPTNPVVAGSFPASAWVNRFFVSDGLLFMATASDGLLIRPTAPNVPFTLEVDAAPGVPFSVETSTNVALPVAWTPLFTTNMSRMPFWFLDSGAPVNQKFYRIHQSGP